MGQAGQVIANPPRSGLVGLPFQWGETDCVCVVFLMADAVFGTDLASLALGKYSTLREAMREQTKGRPIMQLLRSGFRRSHLPIQSGDILTGWVDGFVSLGFVWHGHVYSSDKHSGVWCLPLERVTWYKSEWGQCPLRFQQ